MGKRATAWSAPVRIFLPDSSAASVFWWLHWTLPWAHSCQLEAGRACRDDRCWQKPWGPCCLPQRLLPSCGLLVLSREATAPEANSGETGRLQQEEDCRALHREKIMRWREGKNPTSFFLAKYCVLPPFPSTPFLGFWDKSRPLPSSHNLHVQLEHTPGSPQHLWGSGCAFQARPQ